MNAAVPQGTALSSSPVDLPERLAAALAARQGLLARCAGEGTTAYRLFHGSAEGYDGLAIDR